MPITDLPYGDLAAFVGDQEQAGRAITVIVDRQRCGQLGGSRSQGTWSSSLSVFLRADDTASCFVSRNNGEPERIAVGADVPWLALISAIIWIGLRKVYRSQRNDPRSLLSFGPRWPTPPLRGAWPGQRAVAVALL